MCVTNLGESKFKYFQFWSHCLQSKDKGLVITIGMLETMWVFTTVERGNFTPNWLRTILFVYDFWPRDECTLYTPPSPLPQA